MGKDILNPWLIVDNILRILTGLFKGGTAMSGLPGFWCPGEVARSWSMPPDFYFVGAGW